MVYRNIQTVALLILIAAFGTLLSTVIYDSGKHWRELGLAGEVVENVVKYEGLFLRCSLYPTGQEECGNLDPNNYPEFTTASRVLVIISLGSTVFAILGHFIGWSNTACLYKSKNSDKIKARVIIYAGVFGLLSALLLLVTGIMYSAGVASARSQDFLNQQNAELGGNVGQFRTGYTVALVWVSMALHLVYAALCFLSSWSDAKKSKLEILKQLLPTDFLLGVIERRRQDRVGGL